LAYGQLPAPWFAAGSNPGDYEMGSDANVSFTGQASTTIESKIADPRGFGTAMQNSPADKYLGKRVRMSAYVKTEKVENAAGLWMRVDGPAGTVLSFDNMHNRSIEGTTDWKRYEIVLDVPENSAAVAFGILLAGKGQAWVDGLRFEVVGKDVPTTNMPDEVAASPHPVVQSGPPPKAVMDWVRANAIPLKTVEAGNGFEDLQPLKQVVGDARIVALGEATHGTREFFQLKHRLIEFRQAEWAFLCLPLKRT
jgi:hypothetical protein